MQSAASRPKQLLGKPGGFEGVGSVGEIAETHVSPLPGTWPKCMKPGHLRVNVEATRPSFPAKTSLHHYIVTEIFKRVDLDLVRTPGFSEISHVLPQALMSSIRPSCARQRGQVGHVVHLR